jgi:5'-nucleotidase
MPFEDSVVVKELKGQDIWDALENGFGAYPSQEGRFPQVAGLSITWDSSKSSGKRLVEVCLLEDIHLFHPDGSKKEEGTVEAEKSTTYAFQPSQEGGYHVEVNQPKIRKGAKLEMDKVYRVCTREYMADGHDGYEALTRGTDIIDHESGALMSTLVRKFLLGASLIWRLKSFRENTDESGRGIVGHRDMLSSKTKRAIERANALVNVGGQQEDGGKADKTPLKRGKGTPAPLTGGGFESGQVVVIDSSPGGIRDAIHAGASEHHSQYDAASKLFKDRHRSSLGSNGDGGVQSNDSPYQSPSQKRRLNSNTRPVSAPAQDASRQFPSSLSSEQSQGDDSTDKQEAQPTQEDSSEMSSQQVDIGPEDAETLRQLEADLAVIAALTDGRIVNVAQRKKK